MLTCAKRQKLRAQELQQIKDNILNNLPCLNKRQIRRHRIPYHEALILELLEDGYEESAQFLRSLIAYQEQIFESMGEEAIILNKPMLKNDKTILDILYEGLKSAESGIQMKQKNVEIDKLIELGVYFSNQIEAWWWLADQLFMQSIYSAKDYFDDGSKRHAIARYVFGRFLLNQVQDIERAKHNLRICRDLSNGQSWSAAEVLKIHQGNLFKECCTLMYEALLILSKQKIKTDPTAALKLCTLAHKRALDAEDYVGDAECLFQQGLCEMELDSAQQALQKFSKVLIMHFSTNNKDGICNTRIHLGLAHNKLDNMSEAKYHLHQLLDYSEKHDMKFYTALAHRCLGEMYLSRFIGQEASNHLLMSLQLFHELDDYGNREQAKHLAAIATGLQLIRPLLKLINSCDKSQPSYLNNLMKLVRWKDSREEFWEEGEKSDLAYLRKYMEIYGEHAGPEYVGTNMSNMYRDYTSASAGTTSTIYSSYASKSSKSSSTYNSSITTISQVLITVRSEYQ